MKSPDPSEFQSGRGRTSRDLFRASEAGMSCPALEQSRYILDTVSQGGNKKKRPSIGSAASRGNKRGGRVSPPGRLMAATLAIKGRDNSSGVLGDFRLDFVGIGLDQGAGNRAGDEIIGADVRDRRHFGAGAADEAFFEIRQLLGHDPALDHLDPLAPWRARSRSGG